jgi:hypothetical protein
MNINIAGWKTCGYFNKATDLGKDTFNGKLNGYFTINVTEYNNRTEYKKWLIEDTFRNSFNNEKAVEHTSSPFIWLTFKDTSEILYLGGCDDFTEFCGKLKQGK